MHRTCAAEFGRCPVCRRAVDAGRPWTAERAATKTSRGAPPAPPSDATAPLLVVGSMLLSVGTSAALGLEPALPLGFASGALLGGALALVLRWQHDRAAATHVAASPRALPAVDAAPRPRVVVSLPARPSVTTLATASSAPSVPSFRAAPHAPLAQPSWGRVHPANPAGGTETSRTSPPGLRSPSERAELAASLGPELDLGDDDCVDLGDGVELGDSPTTKCHEVSLAVAPSTTSGKGSAS